HPRRNQSTAREPEGRSSSQYVPDLRGLDRRSSGVHPGRASSGGDLLRPAVQRADDDQAGIRVRTSDQTPSSAEDDAAPDGDKNRVTHNEDSDDEWLYRSTLQRVVAGIACPARDRASRGIGSGPVPDRRSDDRGHAQRDQVGTDRLSGDRARVYRAREGLQQHVHGARHAGRFACSARDRRGARGRTDEVPDVHGPGVEHLPDFQQYAGLPLELGRMEPTISDPSVQQQFGMRVGIPNAGQLNALETLNIRGERSVTCKGDFDRAPSAGPLPPDAPAVCEEFRKQPDALERAAQLDQQYGTKPDLEKLPLYCAVFSFKNWYDAKDMRGTGGNDVNFAMDVPKVDSPDIAELRARGAIIYAVATADNAAGVSARGPAKAKTWMSFGNLKYAQWGGQACNPYDTTRDPRGTSNGSGVSVAANLVTCSICEQGSASCKGPASRNNVVNLLTTKGILMDGGISSKGPGDRAGIHCRTVKDAVTVLDAIKGYETADMFTAIPKALIPQQPYASSLVGDKDVKNKPLRGMRVGIAREFMVKHTKNDVAISNLIDKEIKAVIRDTLSAELVESVDPMYADDPAGPNMK